MEQIIGLWVAAVLTLMVYSFLIADNPLFRVAEHLLIGTALGYATLVTLDRFILASLRNVLTPAGDLHPVSRVMTGLGILWGLVLWCWMARPIRWVANLPMAIVLGVGSALAIGGSLIGTLIPQVYATMLPLRGVNLLDNLIAVVVVLAGLTYFFFTVRRDRPGGRALRGIARFGRWCLLVALGALLGARAISLLSVLVERIGFLGRWLEMVLP